jgi:hypothetical protein
LAQFSKHQEANKLIYIKKLSDFHSSRTLCGVEAIQGAISSLDKRVVVRV